VFSADSQKTYFLNEDVFRKLNQTPVKLNISSQKLRAQQKVKHQKAKPLLTTSTYILEFLEVWQRRLPKHLWRDSSESVPLHLLAFAGEVNFAQVNGTLLVRIRPKNPVRQRRNLRGKRRTSASQEIFL